MKAWPERPVPEAVPRFATPRNLERPTLAYQLVEVSRALGFEPMPWNVANWETQFEYVPTETPFGICCKLWYREARLTVPRQTSKTTATLVRHVHRCLYAEANGWVRPGEHSVCAFTMQHQSDAAKKIRDVWHAVLERSAFVEGEDYKLVKSNGREGVKWLKTGASMGVFPPNLTGAHGDTLDAVDIDEAFSFTDDRAEQGARPAMITRLSPQICIQSTQGTMDSTYFIAKCDDGRDRVNAALRGVESHIYYLDYSCGPEDDINNPDHWPRWMPALYYTIDTEAVALEKEALDGTPEGPDAFLHAYGNVRVGRANQIIPAVQWSNALRPKSFRSGNVWMAVDASPGIGGTGRSASICIASWRDDGIHVEVVGHDPGIMWVPDAIGALTREHKVMELWYDATGPIGSIEEDIRLKSMAKLRQSDAREMVNACARFHQAVLDGTVHHLGQPMLNAAVEGAAKRTLEDGWAWKRAASSADISPLVASTLAHWAAALGKDRGLIMMHTRSA